MNKEPQYYATIYAQDSSAFKFDKNSSEYQAVAREDAVRATGVDINFIAGDLEGVSVAINFMHPDEMAQHMLGLIGFMKKSIRKKKNIKKADRVVKNLKLIAGCVITGCRDQDQVVGVFGFLNMINFKADGLFFFADEFSGKDGKVLE